MMTGFARIALYLGILWLCLAPQFLFAQDNSDQSASDASQADPEMAKAEDSYKQYEAEQVAQISKEILTPEEFKTQLANWDRTARQTEIALEDPAATNLQLENLRNALTQNRTSATNYVTNTQSQVTDLQGQLQAMTPTTPAAASNGDGSSGGGNAAAPESEELKKRRATVEAKLAEVQGNVLSANQSIKEANGLIEQIDERMRLNYYNALLTRSGSALSADNLRVGAYGLFVVVSSFVSDVTSNFQSMLGTRAIGEKWPTSIFFLVFSAGFLIWMPRMARLELKDHEPWPTKIQRILMPLLPTFVAAIGIPTMLSLGYFALSFSGLFGEDSLILLDFLRIWGYFVAAAVWLRWVIIQQNHESRACESSFGWALYSIAIFSGIDWTLSELSILASIPPQSGSSLHFVLVILSALGLWSLSSKKNFGTLFAHTEIETFPRLKELFRNGIRLGVGLAVLLSFIGYFAASYQLFRGVVFTSFIIFASIHLSQFIEAWIIHLLEEMGLQREDKEEEIGDKLWPVLIQIAIWIMAIPLAALSWGVSSTALQELWTRLRAGVALGDIQISLTSMLKLIVFLYFGILIVNLLKKLLDRQVLSKTRMDLGARAAIVSLSGYVGYTLAALVAMSSAGLNLSSLAFIAGALSVGIGFGLQNIVQNFISGVILLIERPIKKGDWIQVGSSEGYVQDIAVRSTAIRTFDDSTIIVPNADLITNAVTNWFHDDQSARVTVAVGVSYDADPDYVEQVLLELVEESSYKRRDVDPSVVIRMFGDSSVHYELRYWINDADWITRARSETFVAILKRFRKEGIIIPYPQRDVRILHENDVLQSGDR